MTVEEVRQELEVSGVEMEHVSKLVRMYKRSGYDPKELDKRLMNWGYHKIFTIYDGEDDIE